MEEQQETAEEKLKRWHSLGGKTRFNSMTPEQWAEHQQRMAEGKRRYWEKWRAEKAKREGKSE